MHSIESIIIKSVYRKLSMSLKKLLKKPFSFSFVCANLSLKYAEHVLFRLAGFDLGTIMAILLASLLLCPANDGECELSRNVELETDVEKFETVSEPEPEPKLGT